MILSLNGIIAGKGSLQMDADAQAFITAANITDTTQQNAVNKLVWDLKGASLWSKMKAIYPFVGGTASSHKFNLKDPRDLDAAFRLVFAGGWTHSSTGALPNGTTGYADTKMNANTYLSAPSSHLSAYNTTANTTGTSRAYLGCVNGAVEFTSLGYFSSGTKEVGTIGSVSSGYTGNVAAFAGFKTIATNGDRNATYYKNGISQQTVTQSGGVATLNIYIGALNDVGTVSAYQNVNLAFISMGDGLSSTDATAFYNAVQTFQTTLGRQV